VEYALYVAQIILCVLLMTLVVLQVRTAGMQNRDSSSIYRTRRGLEKTLFQTTVAVAALFLLLALITSLPIFATATVPAS
jgi:preprotein translocase subunit SecG